MNMNDMMVDHDKICSVSRSVVNNIVYAHVYKYYYITNILLMSY